MLGGFWGDRPSPHLPLVGGPTAPPGFQSSPGQDSDTLVMNMRLHVERWAGLKASSAFIQDPWAFPAGFLLVIH